MGFLRRVWRWLFPAPAPAEVAGVAVWEIPNSIVAFEAEDAFNEAFVAGLEGRNLWVIPREIECFVASNGRAFVQWNPWACGHGERRTIFIDLLSKASWRLAGAELGRYAVGFFNEKRRNGLFWSRTERGRQRARSRG